MSEYNGGWIANLSDGTTVFETSAITGESTAWQRLLAHCKEKNLTITGLQLKRGWGTLRAPSGVQGYFQGYRISKILRSGQEQRHQGIGYVQGDKVHIVWVPLDPWSPEGLAQEVCPLKDVVMHTTV